MKPGISQGLCPSWHTWATALLPTSSYDICLAQLTDEENRKFHSPSAMASAKNWWWYLCGFARGLLWLDERDTDKRFWEMQFIEDIERDIRDICVQDGR